MIFSNPSIFSAPLHLGVSALKALIWSGSEKKGSAVRSPFLFLLPAVIQSRTRTR